jgi:hypothetical protein
MLASPSAAIDLPLKILVSEDCAGEVLVSHTSTKLPSGKTWFPAGARPEHCSDGRPCQNRERLIAYETGALWRLYVRGRENVQRKLLVQAAACNLALLLRKMMGAGTPRALHDTVAGLLIVLLRLLSTKGVDSEPTCRF